MDSAMDIDMDIDMGLEPEITPFEPSETAQPNGISQNTFSSDPTIADAAPEKVHIRGLDELTTNNIKDYITEYYPSDDFVRIEWIDDTSANIVYKTPDAALAALTALSDIPEASFQSTHLLQLRKAKPLPSSSANNNNTDLQVRQAIVTDIKKPRAREASRFYLLHPDQDPGERHNRRGRGGGKATGDRGDYKRRRFDDRENARRQEGGGGFDASMYDDDGGADAQDESDSNNYKHNDRRGRGRFGAGDEDLFAGKNLNGRLRGRSASPLRDGDGDGTMGFDGEEEDNGEGRRRRIRQRSETPPEARRRRRRGGAAETGRNNRKELFSGDGSATVTTALKSPNPGGRELFPDKSTASPRRSRELFPHKTEKSNHRRSDALDVEELADLSSRISGAPTSFGRLRSDDIAEGVIVGDQGFAIRGQDQGFNIRGSASGPGFSIKGAAQESHQIVKELFSMKAGNSGKELFGEKIKGRGGPRRKAEDMYF
ncbi:hypothetical protein EV356DRAFT_74249 [Viridothelium virens]|uniref:Uncharacterized protein n=1 Tax=Viridothelium virens TaxID=1048519 RepID=A0A6A6GRW6_VIRVR|nr:hypothetical protein EV356DRAFT_74249 [Viridothelium virens]